MTCLYSIGEGMIASVERYKALVTSLGVVKHTMKMRRVSDGATAGFWKYYGWSSA
jgi:hypothetical protein